MLAISPTLCCLWLISLKLHNHPVRKKPVTDGETEAPRGRSLPQGHTARTGIQLQGCACPLLRAASPCLSSLPPLSLPWKHQFDIIVHSVQSFSKWPLGSSPVFEWGNRSLRQVETLPLFSAYFTEFYITVIPQYLWGTKL